MHNRADFGEGGVRRSIWGRQGGAVGLRRGCLGETGRAGEVEVGRWMRRWGHRDGRSRGSTRPRVWQEEQGRRAGLSSVSEEQGGRGGLAPVESGEQCAVVRANHEKEGALTFYQTTAEKGINVVWWA
jgi:hypothetical protein